MTNKTVVLFQFALACADEGKTFTILVPRKAIASAKQKLKELSPKGDRHLRDKRIVIRGM